MLRSNLSTLKGRARPCKTNFEFIDDEGKVSEVDALVQSPAGPFLVEIKSRPDVLAADAHSWTWTTDDRSTVIDNPLILANRKAKRLASLLKRQPAITKAKIRLLFASAPCPMASPLYEMAVGQPPVWGDGQTSPAMLDIEARRAGIWTRRGLGRLENPALWPAGANHPPQLTTTQRSADAVSRDAEFMQIAALYADHADFDLLHWVANIVSSEALPFLPAKRYTDTRLRKRMKWKATRALQRREDTIDAEVVAQEAPGWRAKLGGLTAARRGRKKAAAAVGN